ncbi:glutamine amidotransferase [Collinsella sp. AGMB00827]|uniref:Glutamine amidotransferase n=1 Tax=Collinsella ureilytica TaxID=2869515 RepID=A0ABS7MJS4_9ACTN|nr:glutamine amidotransferase [Collinsella urealyticum]MBY4797621.1 glutamine amidotransferase [Collinsella urealyticum]
MNSANQPIIEVLYPRFGCQAGDNGNVMYLKACLPEARFIETHAGSRPYFADARPDLIVMGSMSELCQEIAITELKAYRDRLIALIEADVPMLFTGTAGEVLAQTIVQPNGARIDGLGILDAVVRRCAPERFFDVNLCRFVPSEDEAPCTVVGYKVQFTQIEGNNQTSFFGRNEVGFGLRKGMSLEGFRHHNLLVTSMLGPLLPINPDFTAWLLRLVTGAPVELAFEDLSRAAWERRIQEFKIPGVGIHI